jgi:hypothetical protein
MDVLILRIDEFGVGGVTPSGLDRFVGERSSLKEAVYELKDRCEALFLFFYFGDDVQLIGGWFVLSADIGQPAC